MTGAALAASGTTSTAASKRDDVYLARMFACQVESLFGLYCRNIDRVSPDWRITARISARGLRR